MRWIIIFAVLLAAIVPQRDCQEINSTCGDSTSGAWYYNTATDSCLFLSRTAETWDNAEAACKGQASHLATIERDDQPFLAGLIASQDTNYWIGLRLVNPTLLTHTWVDGNFANIFREWDRGEPEPRGVQDCVVMNGRTGKWRDDYCQRPTGWRYICKKATAPIVPATTVAPGTWEGWGCPPGCQNCPVFRDSCYFISSTRDVRDWYGALQFCQLIYQHPTDRTRSSDLASVHDQLENDFIFSHMGDKVSRWIGLHEDSDRRTLFYSDNTPYDYNNWHPREPIFNSQAECIEIYASAAEGGGRWNDHVCSDKRGFVCKVKREPLLPTPLPGVDNRCDPGFHYLDGACFAVLARPQTTVNPEAACTTLQPGSRLATIASIHENVFVRLLFARMEHDVPTAEVRARLGGKLSTKGRLTWNSGCYPSYNNIKNYYNDTLAGQDSCVVMKYDGTWITTECSDTAYQYLVCEKRAVECPKLITANPGRCPEGFDDECHDYCYRITHSTSSVLTEQMATWDDAKQACIALDASVVSIRSEEAQHCLMRYTEAAQVNMWIGLYDASTSSGAGDWQWLDQDFAYAGNYRNWAAGEPNNLFAIGTNREACTEMTPSGQWNNVRCTDAAKGYICEKLKVPREGITTTSVPEATSASTTPTVTTPKPADPTITIPPAQTTPTPTPLPRPTTVRPISGEESTGEPARGGLSGGGIAGIVVTMVVIVPGLAVGGFLFWRRRRMAAGLTGPAISFKNNAYEDRASVMKSGRGEDTSYT